MEEIREEIAIRLHTRERSVVRITCEKSPLNVSWGDLSEAWQEQFRKGADQILSIKGLRIEADNQDLPCNAYLRSEQRIQHRVYSESQQDMLKEGWVKCKEEHNV